MSQSTNEILKVKKDKYHFKIESFLFYNKIIHILLDTKPSEVL